MTSSDRTKFRQTKDWKQLRQKLKEERRVDYLTQKKLLKGFNLHHLDLNPDHYTNISDPENFLCLNKKSHDCLHFLYNYYIKDPDILLRLKEALETMKKINQ
jgi:hypothetical protein